MLGTWQAFEAQADWFEEHGNLKEATRIRERRAAKRAKIDRQYKKALKKYLAVYPATKFNEPGGYDTLPA